MHVNELSIEHSLGTVDAQQAVLIAGSTCTRYEVVGEAYNPDQMHRVVSALQGRTDTLIPAWLMPDPDNPHDPNAVVVWAYGGKVGYLPRELASGWQPVIARLRARYGCHVACRAALDPPSAANQGGFGVAVWLPRLPSPPAVVASPPAVVAPRQDPIPPVSARPAPATVQMTVEPPPRAPSAPQLSPEELAQLKKNIALAKDELKTAKNELESVEEALEIQSFGFYQPKYGFETSTQYKSRLDRIRGEQQALIKEEKAALCDIQWKVGGSAAAGKKMVKQQSKLMLRAFNGECDAAIAKVRYDNVNVLIERISKAYKDINKLGEVQQVLISAHYLDLKFAELHLVHEHREKLQQEKEDQKRIKEQMREEQQAQQELDRAKAEAEKLEAESAAALEKARADLAAAAATTEQHQRLEGLVNRLETELKDALDRKAKAIARAQLTRSGHVYVLSNIGSFGDGIYKLGMTRRLDPYERVDELGDASVPFPFDVHAIIFSEDAPGLEAKLHQAFASRRVNGVNHRKEYFRVTLDEIRGVVEKLHGLVTFQLNAEAEEWRKTVSAGTARIRPLRPDDGDEVTT